TDTPRDLKLPVTPDARRYTEAELNQEAEAPGVLGPRRPPATPTERRFRDKLIAFMIEQQVAVWIRSGSGETGTVVATSIGPYEANKAIAVPALTLAPEHYNRIVRLLEHKLPVTLEFNIRNEIYDAPESVNVIAEIPGTSKKDEVVMLGAHLDSWHGATGATDNASGVAVV